MDQNIKNASLYFYKLVIDHKNRLEYSTQDRERIKIQLANKQKPTGYRVDWIIKSSNKLIVLMGELAKEFNNMYPEDKISTDDYLDTLTTTIKKIQKFTKYDSEEDD